VPICDERIEANDDNSADGRNKISPVHPVAAMLRGGYHYVATHGRGLLALVGGIAIACMGLGVAFLCDNLVPPLRLLSGIVGVVIPALAILPWAFDHLIPEDY